MNRTLEHILPKVQKPARYTGGEYNAVVKDKRTVDTRFALCFPDTYEIGMSNLGCRILYGLMNEQEGLWCERCSTPWRAATLFLTLISSAFLWVMRWPIPMS